MIAIEDGDMRDKEKHKLYMRKYREKNRWKRSYESAKYRCENPSSSKYKYYGGRGIKLLMSMPDFEYLWDRDGAEQMKDPTIDRIDNDGDYTITNCRFLERDINSVKDKMKCVLQKDKDGNLINIYKSLAEAERKIKGFRGNIWACCVGRLKTHKGYRWEYGE